MSPKTTQRCWMRLRAIPLFHSRSGLWARPRPALLPIIGPRRRGPGRIDGVRGHGTLLFGVRGSPTGFPRNGITGESLRWHLCECIAVPRAEPGVAEGFGGTLQNLALQGCAFLLKPERKQRGRLER